MKNISLAGKILAALLLIFFTAGCDEKIDKEKFYTEIQKDLQRFLEQSKTLIQDVEKEYVNLSEEYIDRYQGEYTQIPAEKFETIQTNLDKEKEQVIKSLQEMIESIEAKDLPEKKEEVVTLINQLNQAGYEVNSQWAGISAGVRKSLQKLLSDNGFTVRIF